MGYCNGSYAAAVAEAKLPKRKQTLLNPKANLKVNKERLKANKLLKVAAVVVPLTLTVTSVTSTSALP
jgi:hypothetical protein